MGADLHIHVMTPPMTMDDFKVWNGHHIGSKYFGTPEPEWGTPEQEGLWERVGNTPNIWIGEVSWLKAALFEDGDTFIPDPVGKVSEIIDCTEDEYIVCTPEVIDKLCEAVKVPVQEKANFYGTIGSDNPNKAAEDLRTFLTPYIGEKLFTISW